MQGIALCVGVRPSLYDMAGRLNLTLYVLNEIYGLIAEVDGAKAVLEAFLYSLEAELPH